MPVCLLRTRVRLCCCLAATGGQLVGSISSVFLYKYSKLGVVLDRDAEGRDMTTRPVRLMYHMAQPGVEAVPRYYALWLCAAAEPGLDKVTFFNDLFAGGLGIKWRLERRHLALSNRVQEHRGLLTCSAIIAC